PTLSAYSESRGYGVGGKNPATKTVLRCESPMNSEVLGPMASAQDSQTIASLDKDLARVKDQIGFHERQAEAYASHPYRGKRHLRTAADFRSLLDRIQGLIAENEALKAGTPRASGRVRQFSLNLTPEDIEGLPEEVIKELGLN